MNHSRYPWMSVLAVLFVSGCGSQAQEESKRSPERIESQRPATDASKKTAPSKPLSADAEAPTGEPARDTDKRGNTPPGSDRAGGAPASGAIVDPGGATQK